VVVDILPTASRTAKDSNFLTIVKLCAQRYSDASFHQTPIYRSILLVKGSDPDTKKCSSLATNSGAPVFHPQSRNLIISYPTANQSVWLRSPGFRHRAVGPSWLDISIFRQLYLIIPESVFDRLEQVFDVIARWVTFVIINRDVWLRSAIQIRSSPSSPAKPCQPSIMPNTITLNSLV